MDILATTREQIGDRGRISRAEMVAILQALADEGLDLSNPYVEETCAWRRVEEGWGWLPDGPAAPETAAAVWTERCRGIDVISVGEGLRDGQVRYDQPGSMHPLQHAALIFAAAELEDSEHDQIGQLARHADRALIVEDQS